MQFDRMAEQKNASNQQLELRNDAFPHPPLIFFYLKDHLGISETLEEHDGDGSLGGRSISSPQFADERKTRTRSLS